jgi:uncharacterized protein (TIRG00374 family)
LVIGFLVSFIAAFIKSEKWRLLLKIAKQEYGSLRAFIVWMISYAYGFITPARAGDFVRVFYLNHDIQLSKAKGFIICLLDRLLDLFALMFTSLIFYTMVFDFPQLIVLLVIAGIIGMYVLLYLTDRYIDVFPAKIKTFYSKSKNFVKSVSHYYTPHTLIMPFFMSVIAWFLSFSQMYFVILAFSKVLSYFLVGAGVSVSLLISLLPVSIGGLGTTELALFTIFKVFSMEEIVAMTFVFNLISLWLPAAIGFLLNVFNGVEMKL